MNTEKVKFLSGEVKTMFDSEEYLKNSRKNPNVFIRSRKMNFKSIVSFVLNLLSKSLQIEVTNFMEIIKSNGIECTKQAVSKARGNLLPEAFIMLNRTLTDNFYKVEDFERYKGYRFFSIDGSTIELPNIPELAEKYGIFSSNSPKPGAPAARISVLYDNLNKIVVDSKIDIYKSSERDHARNHILNLIATNRKYNIDSTKDLIIFDRGYPSLELMYMMNYIGIKYLFRITHSFLKETNESIKESDIEEKIINVNLTQRRITANKLKEINPDIKSGDILVVKLATVKLKSGQKEYLVTNAMEFNKDELAEIYNIRWCIETYYDELKNKIGIENFSGITPNTIEQDFHSAIFVCNYASLIAQAAQTEYEAKIRLNGVEKKIAYKVNKNMVTGHLKNKILKIFLEDDMEKTIDYLIKKAMQNMVAVKKGRTFERNKAHKPKFPIFRKRCL